MAQQDLADYDSGGVTLADFFGMLRKHLRFVIALPLICMIVVGLVAYFLPDEYTAEATMYVLSRDDSEGSSAATQSDLSAAQMLSNDVATLITSDRVKADVAEELGLSDLDSYDLDVTSSTTSRVITLSVTGTDSQSVADVANAIVSDVSRVASEVMQVESVNVVDQAGVPESPSGPNRLLYTLIGLLVGFFVACIVVVLRESFDRRITSDTDIEQMLGVPVVGHFQELRG